MSLDSFFVWHLSEVHRRLRIFLAESDRRQVLRDRDRQAWLRARLLEREIRAMDRQIELTTRTR
jgi:hypothetical protein